MRRLSPNEDLAEEVGVSVKALEWAQENGRFVAESPLGRYYIDVPYRGFDRSVVLVTPGGHRQMFPNAALNDTGWTHIDPPKAAAQEHYSKAILSALVSTPSTREGALDMSGLSFHDRALIENDLNPQPVKNAPEPWVEPDNGDKLP